MGYGMQQHGVGAMVHLLIERNGGAERKRAMIREGEQRYAMGEIASWQLDLLCQLHARWAVRAAPDDVRPSRDETKENTAGNR